MTTKGTGGWDKLTVGTIILILLGLLVVWTAYTELPVEDEAKPTQEIEEPKDETPPSTSVHTQYASADSTERAYIESGAALDFVDGRMCYLTVLLPGEPAEIGAYNSFRVPMDLCLVVARVYLEEFQRM